MIALIGLILVILAWIIQFLLMDKHKKIYTSFVVLYILGVAFLVCDGFFAGIKELAVANLISLLISIAVLVKINLK